MNYSMKVDEPVEFEVNSLYEALLTVRDKRKARGKRYGLASVLTLSVLAKLGGEDEPEGMAEWVKRRAEQLRDSLGMTRPSMPHAVTYRRVLGQAIDASMHYRLKPWHSVLMLSSDFARALGLCPTTPFTGLPAC